MTRPEDDPELRALFAEELRRHVTSFLAQRDDPSGRARTLHALRGAAGMMQFAELAQQLGELETETRTGDAAAAYRAFSSLDAPLRAHGFIVAEFGAAPGSRQTPASSDRPSLDPEVLAYFHAEARARIERFAECVRSLAQGGDPEALDEAFRNAHAIKGAASTVGLTAIARGAHALEAALQTLKARGDAEVHPREVDALLAARAHLGVALLSPDSAATESQSVTTVLRDVGLLHESEVQPATTSTRAGHRGARGVDVMRVPVRAVAGLAESVSEVGALGDRFGARGATLREWARRVGHHGRAVHEALRRIGPARPWGAPADALDRLDGVARGLAESAFELDREGERLHREAELVGALVGNARDALQRLGAVDGRWLFERVVPTADATARREAKDVVVVREGEDTEIPRELAEKLVEPLSQLIRNAVVHGVEPPASRLAKSKPARATIRFEAGIVAGVLRIAVEDDGAGVDIEAAGTRASQLGVLRDEDASDERKVLATLFMPGVSTRLNVDTTAGRGVGLDLVSREVAQAGGTITVTSGRGVFTRFVIDIPVRPLAQRGLVVIVAGERIAIPLEHVVRVVATAADVPDVPVISLSARLRISNLPPASVSQGGAIVVVRTTSGLRAVGVDAVDRAREFVVRPLPSIVAGVAPWSAAALDGEGRVILVVDVDALARDA